MNRNSLIEQILFSHYFEKMFSVLTDRIDKFLSLMLLLLGSSAMADITNPVIVGMLVAAISALQLIYQFGKSSEHSKKQAAAYQKLFSVADTIDSDDELRERLLAIEEDDQSPWRILENPAIIRSGIKLGLRIDEINSSMNRFEKAVAWLAGDLPRQ